MRQILDLIARFGHWSGAAACAVLGQYGKVYVTKHEPKQCIADAPSSCLQVPVAHGVAAALEWHLASLVRDQELPAA